ncbi:MAG: hypothetical protein JNM46_02375 [Anaerolineales bacterium]|nr:hypothetical protein [Anaerolineales bacterium]
MMINKKQMKTRLALTISLIATLACNLTAPTSPESPAPNQPAETVIIPGLCDNPLYPVKQNATWTYFNTGAPSGDFTYTDTITEVRTDGFTLTTQFEGLTRTQAWACETGGLKALEYGGGPTAAITTQNASMSFDTLQVTGISLPKEIVSGMQWLYSLTLEGTTTMPDGQQTTSNGTFTVNMQEMGNETITVPAGTFDAIKIQANSTIDIVGEFQGIQVPMTITGSTITWYAPGVGYIKSISNSDFGGAPFTVTTELQSYNIP